MPTSICGWPVLDNPPWDDKRLGWFEVPGTGVKLFLRKDTAPLFVQIALEWHRTVAPLRKGECDGYDYRIARASSRYSDHSAGVAIDLNYGHEGAQGKPQMSDKQLKACALIAKKYSDVIIWGGPTWAGGSYEKEKYWDSMHWALKPGVTARQVKAVIARIQKVNAAPRPIDHPSLPKPAPVAAGRGAGWLRQFILSKGVSEPVARIIWIIGMRESGGDPGLVGPGKKESLNPRSAGLPHYDVGVFQQNNVWYPDVVKMFGPKANMFTLLDPDNAFAFLKYQSKNFTDWTAWGLRIGPKGEVGFDWKQYPKAWLAKNRKISEAETLRWAKQWIPVVKPPVKKVAVKKAPVKKAL